METFFNFIWKNKDWIFSGVGIAIIGGFITYFKTRNKKQNISNTPIKEKKVFDLEDLKAKCKILFIDDDTKFQVVNILKKAGWLKTKSIKDIISLDDHEIKDTDIFFVDIHGVGSSLNFKDEGLGLASALKDKYPNKKVVIYSSINEGDRFHESLKKADTNLSKNADPYEFQQLVEDYSNEIFNK